MKSIEIKHNNEKIEIYTPFSRKFVNQIKAKIGGAKWDGYCWVANEDQLEAVRSIIKDSFGVDDTEEDYVDVIVTIDECGLIEERGSVNLFSKEIARAYGRDSGAKINKDITFLKGSAESGGSWNYWHTKVEEKSIIKIKDVPERLVKNLTKADLAKMHLTNIEILEKEKKSELEVLIERKEKLSKELEKVNEKIKKLKRRKENGK